MNITKGVRDQIPKSVRVHPKNWQEISDTKKILFKKKNTNIDVSDNHCQPRMYGVSKTSQELRMLLSVTLNCQATKIVVNSGSHLSEL